MVATGVSPSDEVIHEFNKNINRHNSNAHFVIYKVENESQIVTEHISDSDDMAEFASLLPGDDCRYALYKTLFTTKSGRPACKLVMITWTPSAASVRNKMIYAASTGALTSVFGGAVTIKINMGHHEGLTSDALEEACQRFSSS